jgi:hypothetical protein
MTVSEAAYGFQIEGVGVHGALAALGADEWPLVRVRTAQTSDREQPEFGVRDDDATIAMLNGFIAIDRRERAAVIKTPAPIEPAEVVHPYLWPVATVLTRWMGRETFHAGAVVIEGGAWGVVGESGDGKSSLLAWLGLRMGLPVLTDDLLVVDGGRAHAGPRCLDLRPAAATQLGFDGTPVRCTRRRRLSLPPIEAEVPLRGWIFLEWGDELALDRVPNAARLTRLGRFRRAPDMGADGVEWLGLMGLPMVVLRRPRRWPLMDELGQRLLDELAPLAKHALPA